jgi:hypothetical protein
MLKGRCHCGAIQFEIPDQAVHSAICHCDDCRRQSGAPMMAWAMVPADKVAIDGEPKVYASSENGRRSFCGACGTGLFFTNAVLKQMGMMQVRIAALDEPNALAPKIQVQTAERVRWMTSAHELPAFERFPG